MLNYSNLNDVEFEYLCKDIMSRMLNVKLERFGSGRDDGIDLTDNSYRKSIIVQVKHYTKTDVRGLINALKKEIPKIKSNNPNQYYICCSKELTPDNKCEIFALFSDFMESTANIISLVEINDFLDLPENADILKKHFKLWIESTNILTNALTNDVFIDSEGLLSDIEDDVRMFVETSAFNRALSALEQRRVLIIVGNPGVGKSITSKMLVLYYASLGYRVRYTTDGSDLAALKKSLSQSPDAKEIILLDDCFGQAYFSMKETQENELLSLIRHVNIYPNKVLIMNSRVTIFQEAQARTPTLIKSLDRNEYGAYVLNMDNISFVEKARIFYNHLFFYHVPELYREDVIRHKNYRKIVKHRNFNPRIIEFVCSPRQWENITPYGFSKFILQCLDAPNQIWKDEYERRIAETDRMLLTTLYSLTSTTIPLDFAKSCFNYRIMHTQGVDSSINHFEQALARLSESMIKTVDVHGQKMLSVANPSVNDFLNAYLNDNPPEKYALLSTSCSVRQIKRLINSTDYTEKLNAAFADRSIISYLFENDCQKAGFIAYWCSAGAVYDMAYRPYLESFILNIHDVDIYERGRINAPYILNSLFDKRIREFYGLDSLVRDIPSLEKIIEGLELYDLSKFIEQVDCLFTGELRPHYVKLITERLEDAIISYCTDVPADAYDVDIGSLVDDYRYEDEDGGHIDGDAIAAAIDDIIETEVKDEIVEIIADLPDDMEVDPVWNLAPAISVRGSSLMVEQYLGDTHYDYDAYIEDGWINQNIDCIFE